MDRLNDFHMCLIPDSGPPLASSFSCGPGAFITFLAILDNYIRGDKKIVDSCGRIKPTSIPEYEYDFIVVGGGSAGGLVAGRLAEIPWNKVLLIEAGGDEAFGQAIPSMLSHFFGNNLTNWKYMTEPQENACLKNPERRCSWPRGKGLGGTGLINGMMYTRGNKIDYDNWVKAGNKGWSYDENLPFFKMSENNKASYVSDYYHGRKGPITIDRFPYQPELAWDVLTAAKQQGFEVTDDLNGQKFTGFAVAQTSNDNGMRMTSAHAFLRPHFKKRNLHVMINSTVTKIMTTKSKESNRANGVEISYNGKIFKVKACKEVILSAGVINSPQLLLLSGIGPKKDLEKLNIPVVHDLPGVGKNLHNHVEMSLSFNFKKVPEIRELHWESILNYFLNKKGPMSSTGMSQVTAILSTNLTTPDYPDIQLFFRSAGASCASTGAINETVADAKSFGISVVNLHPKSKGVLKLKTSNPFDPPSLDPKYFDKKEDIEVLKEGIKLVLRFTDAPILKEKYGIGIVKINDSNCRAEWNTNEYWNCILKRHNGPENHQVGTCKMGPCTDSLAVVDNELLVYGFENLRVIDASIMPQVVSGNTQGPVWMIAEKGSYFINKKYSSDIHYRNMPPPPPYSMPPSSHHHH